MRKNLITILLALVAIATSAQNQRERINFDKDWQFALGDASSPEKDFGCGTEYFNYFTRVVPRIFKKTAFFNCKSTKVFYSFTFTAIKKCINSLFNLFYIKKKCTRKHYSDLFLRKASFIKSTYITRNNKTNLIILLCYTSFAVKNPLRDIFVFHYNYLT